MSRTVRAGVAGHPIDHSLSPLIHGAWIAALIRLADDKAGEMEIDRKRALKRRDLLVALKGGRALLEK